MQRGRKGCQLRTTDLYPLRMIKSVHYCKAQNCGKEEETTPEILNRMSVQNVSAWMKMDRYSSSVP